MTNYKISGTSESLIADRRVMSKTTVDQARELAKNSSDCSFLLTHLIRQSDDRSDLDSKTILGSILDIHSSSPAPTLKASVTGWYGTSSPYVFNPVTGNLDGTIENRSVCFTESTLAGLKAHRDLFQVKYGLAFDRDNLFNRGANPCLNIRESLLKSVTPFAGDRNPRCLYNFIPAAMQPFVNIIHSSFDATHEREWRFTGDLVFNWCDVKFVFCPEGDFSFFNRVQKNSLPCLFDLQWLDRV
jgi:hypothetical protein